MSSLLPFITFIITYYYICYYIIISCKYSNNELIITALMNSLLPIITRSIIGINEFINTIIDWSNLGMEAPPAGRAAAAASASAFAASGPGPGTALGGGSLLAGGEASVIDPAGPAESSSDSDRESDSESQGSDPENLDQTDEEDDPCEQLKCAIMFKINVQYNKNMCKTAVKIMK